MKPEFELLWNTGPKAYVPHYKEFTKHNPDVKQHITIGKFDSYKEGWRNPDRNIINWWKDNHKIVKTPHVLTCEYDVYINTKINLNFPESGIAVRDLWEPGKCLFPFFDEERPKLPEWLRPSLCAASPLAVILWTRQALDIMSSTKYEEVMAMDLFSEIRVGTIMRHEGLQIFHCQGLHLANYMSREPNEGPGIYHAIKHHVK